MKHSMIKKNTSGRNFAVFPMKLCELQVSRYCQAQQAKTYVQTGHTKHTRSP